ADDSPIAASTALEWGYAGTVFRSDRGFIPALTYACLLGARREREPVGKWTYVGGPLLQNDPFSVRAELDAARALGLSTVTVGVGFEVQTGTEAYSAEWLAQLGSENRELLLSTVGEGTLAPAEMGVDDRATAPSVAD
ncbi:MAG: hypothetical protein ACQKBV_03430, partial [Puniceicoccales bacterium]